MFGVTRRPLIAIMILVCSPFIAAMIAAESADELLERAGAAARKGDHNAAIQLASEAIKLDPKNATAYKLRGRELFCAARIAESIIDLDQFVELVPKSEPSQWERGIAYYYAGKYKQGATQFENYQTFDGHDVENSVWRFLCMAPDVGVAKAQSVMLPIENDRRVPMMQVYEMFRGKLKPDDVLTAAKAGNPEPAALAGQLFYAHLYLALWFDANGKKDEAKRYIQLASDDSLKSNPRINLYMWEVARVHQMHLRGELKTEK